MQQWIKQLQDLVFYVMKLIDILYSVHSVSVKKQYTKYKYKI